MSSAAEAPVGWPLRSLAAGTGRMRAVRDLDQAVLPSPAEPCRGATSPAAERRRLPPVDLSALAAETIIQLPRYDLELLVNVFHHLAGLTPLCTFAGITDDELHVMALHLRAILVQASSG